MHSPIKFNYYLLFSTCFAILEMFLVPQEKVHFKTVINHGIIYARRERIILKFFMIAILCNKYIIDNELYEIIVHGIATYQYTPFQAPSY